MSKCGEQAVLLLGFGGPDCMEGVRPFIESVVKGRNVPAARVDAVVEQYRLIGGSSPYNRLTQEQARKIEEQLAQELGTSVGFHLGFLHWRPFVSEAVAEILKQGTQQLTVLVLAPHRSEASFEKYLKALDEALSDRSPRLEISVVGPWHQEPLFIEAIACRTGEQLAKVAPEEHAHTHLIFTAHSIPREMSDKSQYALQVEQTAAAVVQRLGGGFEERFAVGYQSRSGPPSQPWLEPDVAARLAEARQAGATQAIVVPIGFLVDHVEVLFDLDILAAEAAHQLGMNMLRAHTVGSHEKFVRLLVQLLRGRIESVYA